MRTRVIPTLLLKDGGLYKTKQFSRASYVGDPINTVRIFNTKEVDELFILDIGAGARGPDMAVIEDIVSEAFMPVGYGGGISTLDQVGQLFELGVEKVVVNTALGRNPDLVRAIADIYGEQAIVVGIDVKKTLLGGRKVVVDNGRTALKADPVAWARHLVSLGAGEVLLTSIDREGMAGGYDIELIREISAAVPVPVIAQGGAGNLNHFREAVDAGASAVAAGHFFVYHGQHKAVLISYPPRSHLESLLP